VGQHRLGGAEDRADVYVEVVPERLLVEVRRAPVEHDAHVVVEHVDPAEALDRSRTAASTARGS
jgi:hypothetical protein